MSIPAIILAAGGSRRLRQPKQLLTHHGESLLNRAIRIASEAGCTPVLTVLGAEFETVRRSIESRSVIVIHNDRWRQGMGSSIEAGMRGLNLCDPDATGVLLMGCDQPLLAPGHLRALVTAFVTRPAAIAASTYAGVHGVPAIFPRETFGELRALRGDRGARSIIERAAWPVVGIDFEGGEVDIDTPEDLAKLE